MDEPMKWLLTVSKGQNAAGNYKAWLTAGGIESDAICAESDWNHKVNGYGALLICGGEDVHPSRFGVDAVHKETAGVDPDRDGLEFGLMYEFLCAKKPVFGICRGLQVVGVYFGGKLIQHIPDLLEAADECHKSSGHDVMHGFKPVAKTRLGACLGDVREVNSSHHQSLAPGGPGDLSVAGWSAKGIIEAVECHEKGRCVSAVQWHPERMKYELKASGGLLSFWRSMAG